MPRRAIHGMNSRSWRRCKFEAVGKIVVPGHDVGDERAPLEGGSDAEWFDRGEAGVIRCRGYDGATPGGNCAPSFSSRFVDA